MKIFLPFKKDLNPYLEEILGYTRHSYSYDHYSKYDPSYTIINVHWPEAIFDWHEPSEEELQRLEYEINIWKQNSLLVYTKHDFGRNKGSTPKFEELFRLIEQYTDLFIHLGEYSRRFYKDKYPNSRHELVRHPLYKNSFLNFPRNMARKKLGIGEDITVIIAPGKIRTSKERSMILESFKRLKIKKKALIATNMRAEISLDFRGRTRLKSILDINKFYENRFKNRYSNPEYIFTYSSISAEELSLRVSAADLVLIPRIDILNSGNLFLGVTFGKIVVGPAVGNIAEQLRSFRFPEFDPASISSVTQALEEGIKLSRTNFKLPAKELEALHPKKIAREIDNIFEDLINHES